MVKSAKDCRQLTCCPTASFIRWRPDLPLRVGRHASRWSLSLTKGWKRLLGRCISRKASQKPNRSPAAVSPHPQVLRLRPLARRADSAAPFSPDESTGGLPPNGQFQQLVSRAQQGEACRVHALVRRSLPGVAQPPPSLPPHLVQS